MSKDYVLSDDERTIFAALYIILVIPIFFGNVWIVLSIFFSKKLRTSTTNWIVFWICGNRAVPLITRIPTTLIALLHKGDWPEEIPEVFCSLASGADMATITGASFGVLLLAINRYMKTTKNVATYCKWFNFWIISFHFFIIWILNLLFTSVPPLIGFGSYGYNKKYETCSIDDGHKFNDYYAWVVVTFGFPMQYIFTLYYFAKTFQFINEEESKETMTFGDRVKKVNGIQFAVSLIIIIFYLPYAVLYAVPADVSYPYRNYGLLLVTFSDALIPIVYFTFHPDIKSTCIEMYRSAMINGHEPRKVVVKDEKDSNDRETQDGDETSDETRDETQSNDSAEERDIQEETQSCYSVSGGVTD